jgi:uncharacterized damage-inducible protein DinB
MKELLLQFARYNQWANMRMIEHLSALPEEALDAERGSSFGNIRQTALHLYSAEHIWLQRLELVEHPEWLQDVFSGNSAEIWGKWIAAGEGLVKFVERQYNDKAMSHVVQYYNLKNESFKMEVGEILMHVFNHGSQHRGQLITMLRQAGVVKIAPMDMIVFLRKGKGGGAIRKKA